MSSSGSHATRRWKEEEQYRIRQVRTSYPGPGTDGLLTASKIATLKLNAPTPESQVRIRLPAGGKRIRTIGPAESARRPRGAGSRSRRISVWRGAGGTDGSNPAPSSSESGPNRSLLGLETPVERRQRCG